MAFPTLPDTWAWDDHDMLLTDEAEAAEAARRTQVIHNQIESFAPEALPWNVEMDCSA